MNPKELAGRRAAEFARDGMIVGLGTGSTAAFAIKALGERVESGLKIQAVSTSNASTELAAEVGIEILSFEENSLVDLTIDGADEVDPQLDLVKGLGGALLREKIVATASTRRIIIVDPSKLVQKLATKAPIPVEVAPFGWTLAQRQLMELTSRVELRLNDDSTPFETDNDNLILDCYFQHGIDDPTGIETRINTIPGVVENGLFVGLTDMVIVGDEGGECRLLERS